MTKTNKKCSDNCACSHVDAKNATFANVKDAYSAPKQDVNYAYYSRVLQKPFESISELAAAEEVYHAEQKAKEDKVAQKKADAKKVEDAFKALNAARKAYKEDLAQLTKEYTESLENLKKAFELGKKDIHDKLAEAEDKYSTALKEFTDKYENYHMTLKDGDFETTLSGSKTGNIDNAVKAANDIADLFSLIFGL